MNSPQTTDQSTHLTEYYYIIAKRKWLIITAVLVGLSLALLYNSWMTPVYQTTATLVMGKDQIRSPLTGETLLYESFITQSLQFNTHFRLMKSRPVLEAVIRQLKLDRLDRLKSIETRPWKRLVNQFKKNFYLLMGLGNQNPPSQESLNTLIGRLNGKIQAGGVRDTLLMRISVEDHDPVMAKDIANTLAKAYIQFDIATRMKSSQNTVSWMSDQLYEMKKKLEDAEKEFLTYKQKEKLFSMEGRQGQISQKIDDFNSAYIKARNRRLELNVKIKELHRLSEAGGEVRHVRSLIDNPLIGSLHSKLLDMEVEQSRLSNVFKSKHPQMIQLKTRIIETQTKLKDELNKEMANLEAERAVLMVREQALQKTKADFENDALQINRKQFKYSILQRNVDTYQKLYNTLLSKLKQSNIVGDVDVSNLRIAEKADVPGKPIRPRKTRNLMLGFVLGLMAGIGFAFLLAYLDRTIRTEEDVRRHLGLPVLSVIPQSERAKAKANYG